MIIFNSYYGNNIIFFVGISSISDIEKYNIIVGTDYNNICEKYLTNNFTVFTRTMPNLIDIEYNAKKLLNIQKVNKYIQEFKANIFIYSYKKQITPFYRPLSSSIVQVITNKKNLGILLNNTIISARIYLSVNELLEKEDKQEKLWFVKDSVNDYTQDIECYKTPDIKKINLKVNYIIQEGVTNLDLFENKKYTLRVYFLIHNKKLFLYSDMIRFIHHANYDANSCDVRVHVNHILDKIGKVEKRMPLINDKNIIAMITANLKLFYPFIKDNVINKSDQYLYHLFGADYIITTDNKAVLIEINQWPSIMNYVKFDEEPYYTNKSFECLTDVNIPMIKNTYKCILGLDYENYIEITV